MSENINALKVDYIKYDGNYYKIIPDAPSSTERGGIIAELKDESYTVEVKIGEDGKLYVPEKNIDDRTCLTDEERSLILSLLRKTIYAEDISNTITQLETLWNISNDNYNNNLINFNGDTIITNGTGTFNIVDEHSINVTGGYATVIINNLNPGATYSFNYDGNIMFSLYGSNINNITEEPQSKYTKSIKSVGGIPDDQKPYIFTLPRDCQALLIFPYNGLMNNMVLKKISDFEDDNVDNNGWIANIPYELNLIDNEYPNKTTGEIVKNYPGWTRTDFTPCHGVYKLVFSDFSEIINNGSRDNAWYDKDKNIIGTFGYFMPEGSEFIVPDEAYYFIVSHKTEVMQVLTITPVG